MTLGNLPSESTSAPEMKPEYRHILAELLALVREAMSGPFTVTPVDCYFNPLYHNSKSGGIELLFECGYPQNLCVPEGNYTVMGQTLDPFDTDLFWRRLNERFDVEVVEPQLSPEAARVSQRTGPRVRLIER